MGKGHGQQTLTLTSDTCNRTVPWDSLGIAGVDAGCAVRKIPPADAQGETEALLSHSRVKKQKTKQKKPTAGC